MPSYHTESIPEKLARSFTSKKSKLSSRLREKDLNFVAIAGMFFKNPSLKGLYEDTMKKTDEHYSRNKLKNRIIRMAQASPEQSSRLPLIGTASLKYSPVAPSLRGEEREVEEEDGSYLHKFYEWLEKKPEGETPKIVKVAI